MDVRIGELRNKDIINLLEEHHADMLSHSPPESVHALDLTALESPDVTFWSFWVDHELAGIGALKELDNEHGEIKSMRTSTNLLRKSIARKLLAHIINQANIRSYKKLSLETGTMDAFYQHKCFINSLALKSASLLIIIKKIITVCLCQKA